jgi:3-oxoacyl-[acyl-carrier protein] reductase
MTGQKYCVVLGASGGIGDAISRTLASAGWSLFLHYNENAAHAELLQKELSVAYPQSYFQTVQADFSAQCGAE